MLLKPFKKFCNLCRHHFCKLSVGHRPLLLSPEQVQASTNQILESKAWYLHQELIKSSVKVQLYFYAQYLNEESYIIWSRRGQRASRQAKGQEARSLNGYLTIYYRVPMRRCGVILSRNHLKHHKATNQRTTVHYPRWFRLVSTSLYYQILINKISISTNVDLFIVSV